MDYEALPDYYQILQVHPEAEQEVVEAAFRRLMQKYHPDRLSPEQQQDAQLQERVRAITNAYHVLRSPERRTNYNHRRATEFVGQQIEVRAYPALCSITTSLFSLQLVRSSVNSVFHLVGLDIVQRKVKPEFRLTDHIKQRLQQLFSTPSGLKPHHPRKQTTADLAILFDPKFVLDFGDISWGGFTCPTCPGSFIFPDGMRATWSICGKCGHLYCAGGIRRTVFGGLVDCPACGTQRQITYHVPIGQKANKIVRGYTSSSYTSQSTDVHSSLSSSQSMLDDN